jgi:hypothetical protein
MRKKEDMTAALVMLALWVAVSVMLVGSVAPARGRRSLEWLLGKGPVEMETGRRNARMTSPERSMAQLGSVRSDRTSSERERFAARGGDRQDRNIDVPRSSGLGWASELKWVDPAFDRNLHPAFDRKRSRFPILKKRSKAAHKKRVAFLETETPDRVVVVG